MLVGVVCGLLFLFLLAVKCDSYNFLSVIPSRVAARTSTFGSQGTTGGFICSYCNCLPRDGITSNDLSLLAKSRIVATFRRRAFTDFPGNGCATSSPIVSC